MASTVQADKMDFLIVRYINDSGIVNEVAFKVKDGILGGLHFRREWLKEWVVTLDWVDGE